MSLLKWKECAKSKSELGKKINYVHDMITKTDISKQTNKQSLARALEPVTSKLDDIIDSGLNLRMPQGKRTPKKGKIPDYGISIDDEVEDMGLDDIFGETVSPEQEKQVVPKPPTYEEALKDVMEGKKEIYVDPQYLPEEPPIYDDDVDIDYRINEEDKTRGILDTLEISNYETVEKVLNQPEMTPQKTKTYLNKIIKYAKGKKDQIKGYRTDVTKKFKKGEISETEKQFRNKILDDTRDVLNEYIKYNNVKKLEIEGSGIKGRGRKQKGGNVMFFNDAKQLLKKLELIIGEILAGNNSIQMRNTGVAILDMLLKMATINRPQYNKLYNQYFNI